MRLGRAWLLAFAAALGSGLLMFFSVWFAVGFVIAWIVGLVLTYRIMWRAFNPTHLTRLTIRKMRR